MRTSGESGQGRGSSLVTALERALVTPPELVHVETISMESTWGERFHATPYHELIHVLQGSAQVQFRRRSFVAAAGDTFVIPKGRVHRDVHPVGSTYRVMLILFEWPTGASIVRRMHLDSLLNAPLGEKSHLHLMMRELEAEYMEERSWASERMHLILLEVLLSLLRYSRRGQPPVAGARRMVAAERRRRLAEQVRQHLIAHFDQPITLEDLASRHYVSPFHLSRTFSQEFGISITDMLGMIRMERAKEMLRLGTLSVKEVARRVGFSNPNYFTKAFRRVTGFSPTEFLAMVQQ